MSNLNFASQRPPAHRAPRRGGQAGFSLMEVMVVAAIVAIMAVLAVPSFSGMVQRQRVKNAADAVLSDLRWARSEAIKRGQNVSVNINNLGTTNWQYIIYESETNKEIKRVEAEDFPGVFLAKESDNQSLWMMTFDHVRGTVANVNGNGTLIISDSGSTKKIVISILGRIRINS